MSSPGHRGHVGPCSPEREARVLHVWRDVHNGVHPPVGPEFQAFRQGYLARWADAALQCFWRLYGAQGTCLLDSDTSLEALMLRSGRRGWNCWVDPPWAPGKVCFTSSALQKCSSRKPAAEIQPGDDERSEYVQYTIKQETPPLNVARFGTTAMGNKRLCQLCPLRKARFVAHNSEGELLFLCAKHGRLKPGAQSLETWQRETAAAERVRASLERPAWVSNWLANTTDIPEHNLIIRDTFSSSGYHHTWHSGGKKKA